MTKKEELKRKVEYFLKSKEQYDWFVLFLLAKGAPMWSNNVDDMVRYVAGKRDYKRFFYKAKFIIGSRNMSQDEIDKLNTLSEEFFYSYDNIPYKKSDIESIKSIWEED